MSTVMRPQKFSSFKCLCSSETIKAMDFKFDRYVPNDSPDVTPWKFLQHGVHLAAKITLLFVWF